MARLIDADALIGPLKLLEESYRRCGAIERAEAYANCLWEIEQAPTVDGWISVKDRLPDMGAKCVIYRDGKMSVAKHIANNDWITQAFFTYPTHWMPLPEPPKEEQ